MTYIRGGIGMSNAIEINPTVLEAEITYLNSLLTSKIEITQEVSSSGQAADGVKLLLDYIVTLESSLEKYSRFFR